MTLTMLSTPSQGLGVTIGPRQLTEGCVSHSLKKPDQSASHMTGYEIYVFSLGGNLHMRTSYD